MPVNDEGNDVNIHVDEIVDLSKVVFTIADPDQPDRLLRLRLVVESEKTKSPFDKFKSLTQKLLAVPKEEIDKK